MKRGDEAVAVDEVSGRLSSSGVSGEEEEGWEVNGDLIFLKQRLRFLARVFGIISTPVL